MNKINSKSKMAWIEIDANYQSMCCMEPDIGYWESFASVKSMVKYIKDNAIAFALIKDLSLENYDVKYNKAIKIAKDNMPNKMGELQTIEKMVEKIDSENNIKTLNELYSELKLKLSELDINVEFICFNSPEEAKKLVEEHGSSYEYDLNNLNDYFEADTLI